MAVIPPWAKLGSVLRGSYPRAFVRNNLWVAFGQLVVSAKALLLLPLLVKSLGAGVYGTYSLLMSGVGLVYGVSSFGVGFRYQRFAPAAATVNERRALFYGQFWPHLISVSALALLVVLTDGLVKQALPSDIAHYSPLVIVAVLLATLAWSQATDFFRYTNRLGYFSLSTTLSPYLEIALILLMLRAWPTVAVDNLLAAGALAMGLACLPFASMLVREIGVAPPSLDLVGLRNDVRTGLPLVVAFVADSVLAVSDRYVIALNMSAADVGAYVSAYVVGSLPILLPRILRVAILPLLCRAQDTEGTQEVTKLVNLSVRLFLAVAVPFVVGAYVLARPVLTLLADQNVAARAAAVTPMVALAMVFFGLTLIISQLLFVSLRTTAVLAITMGAAASNVLLNVILLHFFRSIVIPAGTTLVCYCAVFVILQLRIRHVYPVRYDISFIARVMLAALAMGAVVARIAPTTSTPAIQVAAGTVVGVVTYLAFLTLLSAGGRLLIRNGRTFVL